MTSPTNPMIYAMIRTLMAKAKTRRDQRPRHPTPMEMTERDREIIHAVHEYRVLKQSQITRLFFRTGQAASRVLQRLYHHGYLDRRLLPVVYGKSPTLYVVDRRGVELLRATFGLEEIVWYPSNKDLKLEFLEHTLAINDVRIAITKAACAPDFELRHWINETELKADYDRVTIRRPSGKVQNVSLIPDSYLVLRTPFGLAHLFLELDRGTMSTERFVTKILAYQQYQKSGAYTKRYNARSMRVITVTSSEKRLASLKLATEKVGGSWQFSFAVLTDVNEMNVFSSPIWQVAGKKERELLFT